MTLIQTKPNGLIFNGLLPLTIPGVLASTDNLLKIGEKNILHSQLAIFDFFLNLTATDTGEKI